MVTLQPRTLSYFVPNPATQALTYDRLRFWRSRTGSDGLYEAATALAAAPAVLEGTKESPHQLNGKTLSLRVNGVTQVDVVFTDPDPVTTAQVVTAINAATALIVASDEDVLRLVTAVTGSGASIEILESDAAPFLGFSTDDVAVGLDTDRVLTGATHEYGYTDQNSDSEYWYRVELFHSSTGQTSGLGVPFQAGPAGIADADRIWAFIRLADFSGLPIGGRAVTLANPFLPNTVTSGGQRWGLFRHYATMTTDADGYAQLRVVRGMQVDVAVGGTNFVRRLEIPTTGDSVDLLDPDLAIMDEFGIQEPQIDFALRTT